MEELLNILLQNNFPFAAYSLPGNETNINIVIQKSKQVEILKNLSNLNNTQGFLIHPFNKNDFPIYLLKPDIYISEKSDLNYHINELKNLKFTIEENPNFQAHITSKPKYFKQIQELKNAFVAENISKIVLSRIISIKPFNHGKRVKAFIRLINQYPSAFVSFFNIPGKECWMGASPESIINRMDNHYQVDSIAGTQKITFTNIADHSWTLKEYEEQRLVSQYIQDILKKNNIDEFSILGPENYSTGNLVHLKTIFSFPFFSAKTHLSKILNKLHPTPALCGYPKEKSLKQIKQVELHNRLYYSGFLGPVNLNNELKLFVNIRCCKFATKNTFLFVGGGILPESNPALEWNETELKSETLLSIFKGI